MLSISESCSVHAPFAGCPPLVAEKYGGLLPWILRFDDNGFAAVPLAPNDKQSALFLYSPPSGHAMRSVAIYLPG